MKVSTVYLLFVTGCFGSEDEDANHSGSLKSHLLFSLIMANHNCSFLLITMVPLIRSHLQLVIKGHVYRDNEKGALS